MSFRVGDPVRARRLDTGDHHRLPHYVQGKPGTISAYRGAFVLPDVAVHGGDRTPRALYGVRFAADQLWPAESGGSSHTVHLDLYEDYLELDERTAR